ncbi:restriction endonuclease [Limnothrix sp. FACHB-881]|uniref:restriction endonuclease n=1 Tax=Limnothrix sp. FACHB-881 TaxID=2692819 RepID=UPI001685BC15|nr:restriction endonuclease [Limnothrix sp. FACHB-881]MBD2634671.1 restriction endonuclease [Limnothrix sp. FACHB-881]
MTHLPKHDQMYASTIEALKLLGGSGTIQEIYDQVCELEGFTEEQQNILHKNGPQTLIAYRLAWTRTYLKNYGAIESNERGNWSLTATGWQLTPVTINRTMINSASKKRVNHHAAQDQLVTESDMESFDELVGDTQAPALLLNSDQWIEKLLEVLQSLSPDAFERLCQRILRESGFTKVQVTGRKGDGGIDGVGVLKIALLSFQVFFQCKRYKGSVGPGEIRDFRGSMIGRTDKGLFLTTGTFTVSAKQEATRDGAPALDLIDGEELCRLLVKLQLGVKTKTIEVVEINQDWFKNL